MKQFNRPPQSPEVNTEQRKQEYITLAQELSETQEGFPFPGMNPESYSELKAVAEEFPEYSTQIDELVNKFQTQGMRVILSKDPKSGIIFILPLNSTDTEMDNIFPRHLQVSDGIDERLKKLITMNRELSNK